MKKEKCEMVAAATPQITPASCTICGVSQTAGLATSEKYRDTSGWGC
jgi:hypothetical protein